MCVVRGLMKESDGSKFISRVVSYLPLSHIAGLIMDVIHLAVYDCELYFAKPDALQGSLVETL
jgi:long-chain-fatty-acid--CoA ligase ACSBG